MGIDTAAAAARHTSRLGKPWRGGGCEVSAAGSTLYLYSLVLLWLLHLQPCVRVGLVFGLEVQIVYVV